MTYPQDPRKGDVGTVPSTPYLERNLALGREQIFAPALHLNEEWQAFYADSGVTMNLLVTSPFDQSGITVHDSEAL